MGYLEPNGNQFWRSFYYYPGMVTDKNRGVCVWVCVAAKLSVPNEVNEENAERTRRWEGKSV